MTVEPRGTLEAIWIKRARLGPMDPAPTAITVANRGLVGNANQGGNRQVTIIEREVFERLSKSLGRTVEPIWRRANLMVSGISLAHSRGKVLRIGDLTLEVMGETKPCERMDQALPGLREALRPDWGGGIYGIVLNDAELHVGDRVQWQSV